VRAASRLVVVVSALGLVPGCSFIARVSLGPGGVPANAGSLFAAPISGDGRYVAFLSDASNLVAGDTNDSSDLFRRDNVANVTELVTVGFDGSQANGDALVNDISGDGRFVAFQSSGSNLVEADSNGETDVFVRDMATGTNELVSVSSTEVAADKSSGRAFLSADGRYAAFTSEATNLVPNDTNGDPPCDPEEPSCTRGIDTFVRDLLAGTTHRVSVASDGSEADSGSGGLAISDDGRFVLFASDASNLVPGSTTRDLFMRDRVLGTTEQVDIATDGAQANSFVRGADMSADGRFVAFVSAADNLVPNDTNGREDLFVRDRFAGTTERASVTSAGVEVALGAGESAPSMSADGRFVAFTSLAPDLVSDDTNNAEDVFVRDRLLGTTTIWSTNLTGAEGQSPSFYALSVDPRLSADARYVSFWSQAENLVDGDTNGFRDTFVKFVGTPTPTAILPATVAPGATAQLVVSGSRFNELDGVSLGNGVTVTGWTVESDTRLLLDVTVAANAPLGPRTLLVAAPGTGGALYGGVGSCEACLTIG
jgi:Tol biopolymer transport system component